VKLGRYRLSFRRNCPASPRRRKNWLTILFHALLIRPGLSCAAFCRNISARTPDPSHGPLIVGVDPGRAQRKAGPGTFYRSGISERAVAVRRAANVQPHGAAAAWRLTVGLVGRDGVLPVDAAGRLCLRAFPCGHTKSPAGCRHAPRAPDRRAFDAATVDCRLGRASGIRDGLLAAGPVYGLD